MGSGPILELTIDSDLDEADQAVDRCAGIAQGLGFSEPECSDICMAFRESVNNAVIHGNHRSKEKSVHIEISGTPGQITLRIRDEGDGFDPSGIPDPTAPENLMKPCGRGIFLMRHFMDDVAFRFSHPHGTEVRLVRTRRARD